jgi:oxaloacetate decarboxylase alpha subunit
LTPERVRTLVPAVRQNTGDIPLEFHSHCTTGLAPLCYLEAVKQGITTLHAAIPPLANGPSQPSVLNLASNLRFLGYAPIIDETAIEPVVDHFNFIAKRENRPRGAPVEYDYYQYIHQIPGGVINNLKRQLTPLKLIDKLPQVIEECIRVRKDFGYPIMVTPFSQYIATQAAINVALGERYKQVVDDLIYYALGFWGKDARSAIDAEVMDKIMELPRAKELKNWEFPEPSLNELREQYGGGSLSDDELLLRYIIGSEDDIKAMRSAGPARDDKYLGVNTPLTALLKELLKRRDLAFVSIQTKQLGITIDKY